VKRRQIGIGIVGGGLMGRESASAFARWRALIDVTVEPKLVGVADLNPAALEWFDDGQTFLTPDYRQLLDRDEVEVVYVAVPHNLHEKIYREVLEAGKDLLAEKPFGIDLAAAAQIASVAESTKRFVRCSSEFPFLPGAQRAIQLARSGQLGRLLEVVSGLHHSSDIDPTKTANWKRQNATCGENATRICCQPPGMISPAYMSETGNGIVGPKEGRRQHRPHSPRCSILGFVTSQFGIS
jgi:predicted dehydrogenase